MDNPYTGICGTRAKLHSVGALRAHAKGTGVQTGLPDTCSRINSLCEPVRHTADKSLKAQVASTVEEIHSEAEKLGLDIHLYVANALISTYASCGNMQSARDVFERIEQRQRDVVSWTALVLGYAENDQPEVALELFFKQMDVKPNHLTYTAGLTACMASAELQSGRKLHGHICRSGLESHVHLSAKLLEFYAKCGTVSTALHLFESVPYTSLDVSSWNTLLSAYSRQGDTNRSFHIFNMMRDQGVVPNGVTFLGLLTACSHAGLVDVGRKLFKEMHVELGFVPGLDHFHCVADMLARGNRLILGPAATCGMHVEAENLN